MKKSKTTKRALLSSCIALMLCFSMLLGTTYAWFTDEVISSNNIIKSGTLEAEMLWKAKVGDDWTDASAGPIFTYQYWEPGYVDVKYIQLKNVGDLAFNYQLRVVPENAASDGMKLAEVIDVYVATPGTTDIDRDDISGMTKLGTLKDLMVQPTGVDDGVLLPVEGNTQHIDLSQITDEYYVGDVALCVALKMQEEAGNEYQNLSIGDGFTVKLLATQYTYENDSFDHLYDEWANGGSLTANVTKDAPESVVASWDYPNGTDTTTLRLTPFTFKPTESYEAAQESPLRYYHADFVVYADKDVAPGAVALAGYYKAFCDDLNNGNWVALKDDSNTIPAGNEIRLVESLTYGSGYVNYEEICKWGNDGTGFRCGAVALDPSAVGTTLTVELRLYETTADPSDPNGPKNIETGEYIIIDTFKHTLDLEPAEKLAAALAAGGEVVLADDITVEADRDLIMDVANGTVVDGSGSVISINGGKTDGILGYLGFVPAAGEDVTIKNVTVEGSGFVEIGHHTGSSVIGGGDYTVDNLVIKNLETTFAVNEGGNPVSAAFAHYGNAVMNNCVITGTTTETSAVPYDAAFTNKTNTEINGGEYGLLYLSAQAHVTINDAVIGAIDSAAITTKNLGCLTIGAGTHVGTIKLIPPGNYKPALVIEDGATVDAIIYDDTTFTQAEWLTFNP